MSAPKLYGPEVVERARRIYCATRSLKRTVEELDGPSWTWVYRHVRDLVAPEQKPPRLTASLSREVVRLYVNERLSLLAVRSRVEREHGVLVSDNWIRRQLRRRAVVRSQREAADLRYQRERDRPPLAEVVATARRMAFKGASVAEVAEALGVEKTAAAKWIRDVVVGRAERQRRDRRRRVLQLRAKGLSLTAIARAVGCATGTVRADLVDAGLFVPFDRWESRRR